MRLGGEPIVRKDRREAYKTDWITVFEDTIDRSGDEGLYYIVDRADAVTVVLTTSDGTLLLLESFRYPTGSFSLELPMGAIGPGESPEAAAMRELEEETGIDGASLSCLGWFFALPGLTAQRVHVFAGSVEPEILEKASTAGAEVDLTGVSMVHGDEVGDLIRSAAITDSLTLCSLFLAGLGEVR